MSRFDSAVL